MPPLLPETPGRQASYRSRAAGELPLFPSFLLVSYTCGTPANRRRRLFHSFPCCHIAVSRHAVMRCLSSKTGTGFVRCPEQPKLLCRNWRQLCGACTGNAPSAKLAVLAAPPVVVLHSLLLAVSLLLAFQTQTNTRQRTSPCLGNGFAAGFAEHQALASGQAGPRPSDFIIDRILNLILNSGISCPANCHGYSPLPCGTTRQRAAGRQPSTGYRSVSLAYSPSTLPLPRR